MKSSNNILKSSIFPAVLIVMVSSTIVLFASALLLRKTPYDLLTKIYAIPYMPHVNIFFAPLVDGVNLYVFFYAILYCSLLLTIGVRFLHKERFDRMAIASFSVLILYGLITALLTKQWAADTLRNIKTFSGKTTEEKNAALRHNHIFIFAQFCRSRLPEKGAARIVTDLDLTRDPGMFYQRRLAYYLYPIDMRNVRQEEPEIMIIFAKHNAKASVPEDFEILASLDEENLVAVKKKP